MSAKKHRTSVERMMHIAYLLRRGTNFNSRSVARHFEIAEKTVQRDLKFMRDRMNYEIDFDPALNTFRLKHAPTPFL